MITKLATYAPALSFAGTAVASAVIAGSTWNENTWVLLMGSAMTVLVSMALMRPSGALELRHPTIPGVWYLTYFPMIFFPALVLFWSQDGPGRVNYLLAVHSTLIAVPLGALLVTLASRFHRRETAAFYERTTTVEPNTVHMFVIASVGWLIAIVLIASHIRELPEVPVVHLVLHPGDYDTLVGLREETFKLLDSPLKYFYHLLLVFGFPTLILLTLGYFRRTKAAAWWALWLMTLASGVLYATLSLAKSPVAAIIVMIFLFRYVDGSRLGPFAVMVWGALMLAWPLVIALGFSYGSHVGFELALLGIAQRLFYTPAYVLYWYFELFPFTQDYLYGRSIGAWAWLWGLDHFSTPAFVGRVGLNADLETVNANAAFIGNLNADFGLPGVVFGGALTGMLMQAVQVHLVRRKKDVLSVTQYSYMVFAAWFLHSTALPVMLASNGVILMMLTPLLVRRLAGCLRIATVGPTVS